MHEREYDVVLYGASGFTGRQTVQYFAKHVNPDQVRWAIAGRKIQCPRTWEPIWSSAISRKNWECSAAP